MGSRRDFAHVLPALEKLAPVHAYDQRGHGSARDRGASGSIDLELLSADLSAELDERSIRRAHLLGHSMGGMVALRLALSHPDRVASLILMCTGANAVPMGPIQPLTL